MDHLRVASSVVFTALLFGPIGTAAEAADPLGRAPTYSDRALGTIPPGPLANARAVLTRIWVPGLDDDYVPQGLTVVDGALYVGSYKSGETGGSRGPCRLFRVDMTSGAVTGTLDLPPACGHAGGLARGAQGHLWVADTRDVFEIALARPGEDGVGRITRHLQLIAPVKGSFAAGDGAALWLGSFERHGGGRLFRFPLAGLKSSLNETDADATIQLPTLAQGAAFDATGGLWISRSGPAVGELLRLDPKDGRVLSRFAMPAGLEDLSFDAGGRLWTLSEAGARKYRNWSTFLPIIMGLDPAQLR